MLQSGLRSASSVKSTYAANSRLLPLSGGEEANEAEQLISVRGGRGGGHIRPPVPAAVGIPDELTDLGDRVLNLGREFGRREGSTQEVQAFNAAI